MSGQIYAVTALFQRVGGGGWEELPVPIAWALPLVGLLGKKGDVQCKVQGVTGRDAPEGV